MADTQTHPEITNAIAMRDISLTHECANEVRAAVAAKVDDLRTRMIGLLAAADAAEQHAFPRVAKMAHHAEILATADVCTSDVYHGIKHTRIVWSSDPSRVNEGVPPEELPAPQDGTYGCAVLVEVAGECRHCYLEKRGNGEGWVGKHNGHEGDGTFYGTFYGSSPAGIIRSFIDAVERRES